MKKFLGFCVVGLWAGATFAAAAPLILDWGTLDTAAAGPQKATQALQLESFEPVARPPLGVFHLPAQRHGVVPFQELVHRENDTGDKTGIRTTHFARPFLA